MLGERQLFGSDSEERRSKAWKSRASIILATVVVTVVVIMSVSVQMPTSATSHVAVVGATPGETRVLGDVIGPDLPLSNAQQLIYENEKILYTSHGQSKKRWLATYNQFNASARLAQDIPLNTYLAMVYAQLQFHIDATAENVHLFISDAAYGLMISYKVKSGWLVSKSRTNQLATEERKQVLELKRSVKKLKGFIRGMVKTDVANPALASLKLAASKAAYTQYQSLIAKGNVERAAWMSDLNARNSAQSMTYLQHLDSIRLFTLYKITKTAELVQEYAWIINYTEYLRWAFGNTFLLDAEWRDRLENAINALDVLSDQQCGSPPICTH